MKNEDIYDWVIGISCSDADGIRLYNFRGSISETKLKLLELISEDKTNDIDNWDYGCEESEDIQDCFNGLGYELYGYGIYSEYHIDYTAKEISHIEYIW